MMLQRFAEKGSSISVTASNGLVLRRLREDDEYKREKEREKIEPHVNVPLLAKFYMPV